ncbi:hypothetical protein QE152_g37603 [Popillia japonica]|uniref:Uncharacterized protein n=1 Tax=Popillia japonica TaxID=7064 RepID=A0AAW1I9E9_POPJA
MIESQDGGYPDYGPPPDPDYSPEPPQLGNGWQELRHRHFIVYIYDEITDVAFNGVRILPYVVLSSPVITEENKYNYKVTYRNYYDEDTITTYIKLSVSPVEGGKNKFVVIFLQEPPSEITPIPHNTVEIVTRLEPIDLTDCIVFFVEAKNLRLKVIWVDLIASESTAEVWSTEPSDYEITSTDLVGIPLICNERVVGMRINENEAKNRYTFLDIRHHDYWLLSKIHPNGFYDYSLVPILMPLSRASSLFDFNRTKIISGFLITYLCNYIAQ